MRCWQANESTACSLCPSKNRTTDHLVDIAITMKPETQRNHLNYLYLDPCHYLCIFGRIDNKPAQLVEIPQRLSTYSFQERVACDNPIGSGGLVEITLSDRDPGVLFQNSKPVNEDSLSELTKYTVYASCLSLAVASAFTTPTTSSKSK
jgi:hypothetical protein